MSGVSGLVPTRWDIRIWQHGPRWIGWVIFHSLQRDEMSTIRALVHRYRIVDISILIINYN